MCLSYLMVEKIQLGLDFGLVVVDCCKGGGMFRWWELRGT